MFSTPTFSMGFHLYGKHHASPWFLKRCAAHRHLYLHFDTMSRFMQRIPRALWQPGRHRHKQTYSCMRIPRPAGMGILRGSLNVTVFVVVSTLCVNHACVNDGKRNQPRQLHYSLARHEAFTHLDGVKLVQNLPADDFPIARHRPGGPCRDMVPL
jgi:hypothetical protein